MGIVSTFSAAWWGKRIEKNGIKKNLIAASIITGTMYAVHSIVHNPALLIPVRIVLGFSFGALFPTLFTTISNNVTSERRGGVLGVASSFQILGNMTGPLIGGYAVGFLGLRTSFLITGAIYFIIGIISLMKLKD
jgi:MFS family permease